MTSWKTALTRAINAEVAAEKAATQAETERRSTWWDTTWALATVPRAEWGEAQALYVQRTGHSKLTADSRRRTGTRLDQTSLAGGLPQPRFGREAAEAIGKNGGDVAEYVKLLRQAERDELSVREFRQLLTGKPWTNSPENLTEADEDAVLEKVARTRPAAVARHTAKPQVAAAVVADPQATKSVIQQQSARTQRIIKKRREAVVAAGADTKGEVAEAVDASHATMNTTAAYNKWNRSRQDLTSAWQDAIREQEFTAFDRHHLGADLPALRRFVAEVTVFVEADDDPYIAVKAHRAEVNEEIQREMDAADAGTSLDTDEIEQFANKGV